MLGVVETMLDIAESMLDVTLCITDPVQFISSCPVSELASPSSHLMSLTTHMTRLSPSCTLNLPPVRATACQRQIRLPSCSPHSLPDISRAAIIPCHPTRIFCWLLLEAVQKSFELTRHRKGALVQLLNPVKPPGSPSVALHNNNIIIHSYNTLDQASNTVC